MCGVCGVFVCMSILTAWLLTNCWLYGCKDAVLKSGGGASDVFKSAILKGEAHDAVKNAFKNVQDKYQDVLALEASVAELNQMFLDFALLVDQQGELLDQIEFQVKSASDFIDEGNVEMVQAVELQIGYRKKQCCCALACLILLGVIAGIAYAVLKTKGNI